MKRWIVLTLLVAACVPLPYVGGIVTQAAQAAEEQAREEERQAAQQRAAEQARARAQAQAEQQARWEAARQAQARAEAARQQQEALREQEAARLRWQAAQQAAELRAIEERANRQQAAPVSAQLQGAEPGSAAESLRPDAPATPVATDKPRASLDDPFASEGQPTPNPAPRLPPLTVAADPPAAHSAAADPPDPDVLGDSQRPRRLPTPSQRSQKVAAKRKPAAPAKRYELIQVLMCNDGTESPTCTCGGPRRGCCSHHGGVSGCESRRIPLDP